MPPDKPMTARLNPVLRTSVRMNRVRIFVAVRQSIASSAGMEESSAEVGGGMREGYDGDRERVNEPASSRTLPVITLQATPDLREVKRRTNLDDILGSWHRPGR